MDQYDCSECGRSFATQQGMRMHVARSHRKATAAVAVHDAFERVGAATEALFPEGIPAARIIEIADLQKAMLKVLTR
jgi:hypothetical protein